MVSPDIEKPELEAVATLDLTETFRQRLTLEQLVELEEDPLDLLTAPVELQVSDSPQHTFYSINFLETPLFGYDFISLLTHALPKSPPAKRQSYQGKSGILGDWNLLDVTTTTAAKLAALHQADLDPYWTEFNTYHRRKFMTAVTTLHPEEIEAFFSETIATFISKEPAIANLKSLIKQKAQNYPYFYKWTQNFLLRHYEELKDWLQVDGTRISKKALKKEESGRLLAREFIHQLPDDPELKTLLVEKDILGWPRYKKVIDTQSEPDPQLINNLWNYSNNDYSLHYLGNNRVRIGIYDSWAVAVLEGQGATLEETFIEDGIEKALIPWIVWAKNKITGERIYLSSQLPTQLDSEVDSRTNTLLGLLTATYLSPKQRLALPSKKYLKWQQTQHGYE